MTPSFLLAPGSGPQDYATRRAMIQAMMPQFGKASTIGEGLGQLFTGIGLGRQQKALDAEEAAARQSAMTGFDSLMSRGGTAQPGGMSINGPIPMQPPSHGQDVANDAMAALGYDFAPGDRDSFINAMMPYAQQAAAQTGLDPRLIIAQAAQETGWGKHAPGNNFFGVKSHGRPGGNALATQEVENGVTLSTSDSFRNYGSMGESVMDYARFLQENPRYAEMLSAPDLAGQVAALGQSGYATDPNYANAVGSIANSIPGTGPSTAELAAAAANPMLTEGQRAMAAQMLQEAQKQQDPAYQVGLQADQLAIQKSQIELAQMQNPKPGYRVLTGQEAAQMGLPQGTWQVSPDGQVSRLVEPDKPAQPTDDMREYNLAVSQGYTGSFQEYMLGMKKAGASSVSVNTGSEVGTIPQGYELYTDPTTGARSMRAIAGGPEDMSKKNAVAADAKAVAGDIITTAADRALQASRAGGSGTGQGFFSMMPWTDSREVSNQVDVLKSQAKIENLTQMRAASPTGGALGAVTDKESEMLAAKSGALDPSSPNFERDLADYTLTLLKTVHGEAAGQTIFEQTWTGDMPSGAATKMNAAPVAIQDDAQYDALPSGTVFIAPDGTTRRKP